jgi:hypothetical protein
MACQAAAIEGPESSEAVARALYVLVTSRLLYDGDPAWFTSVFARASRISRELFSVAYSAAPRRVGEAVVTLSTTERDAFMRAGCPNPPDGWRLDECARGALLLEVARLSPVLGAPAGSAAVRTLLADVFSRGDKAGQAAALRVLAYMPGAAALADCACWAIRSRSAEVFDALAFENPFAARHLPRATFNELVHRATSLGRDTGRIVGLDERADDVEVFAPDRSGIRPRAVGASLPRASSG